MYVCILCICVCIYTSNGQKQWLHAHLRTRMAVWEKTNHNTLGSKGNICTLLMPFKRWAMPQEAFRSGLKFGLKWPQLWLEKGFA